MSRESFAARARAVTITAFDQAEVDVGSGALETVRGFVLQHPSGIEATVLSYGAHLVSVRLPDTQRPGTLVEVTRGPTAVAELRTIEGRFMGATIGRFANRIAGASFELDRTRYVLEANDPPNHLHGGTRGFHARVWEHELLQDGSGVRFALVSVDGDGGYPGAVHAAATYRLGEQLLEIDYQATTTASTPLSLTNHTYWNLAGPDSNTIGDHRLRSAFDRVLATDSEDIPIDGPPLPVAGIRFDVNGNETLEPTLGCGGLDHCYVALEPIEESVAVLDHAATNRRLSITTNQIGLQVYTGNHLVPQHQAIAFEPQSWPDSPNRADFPSAVVEPGETYTNRSTYRFDWSV